MAKLADKWVSKSELARQFNTTIQVVNNWITRGNVKWKYLPNSKNIVVDNTSVEVKKYSADKGKN